MTLNATLAQLENAQIIRPTLDAETTFLFKHSLMQDAAYQSLLQKQRREIHARVAHAIEELYPDRLDESAAQLAQHYAAANDDARALDYAMRAGNRAARLYALPEAIAHFTLALTIAERANAISANVYRARGLAYEGLGYYEQARTDQQAALQSARATQDRHAEWQALIDLGNAWAERDYRKTGEYYRHALAIAREMKDHSTLAHSLNRIGNWYINREEPQQALEHHQQALAIFQRLGDARGVADTLDFLGMASSLGSNLVQGAAYYRQVIPLLRDVDNRPGLISGLTSMAICAATHQTSTMVMPAQTIAESNQRAESALDLARATGLRSAEAFALIILSLNWDACGDFNRALETAGRSLAITQEINHRQWMTFALAALGMLYADLGAYAVARAHLEDSLSLANEIGSWHWIRTSSGFLASVCILQNDLTRADKVLDDAFGESDPQTLGQRLVVCARVELALARNQPHRALELLQRLIDTEPNAEPAGRNILRVSMLRGRVFLALNQWDEAFTAFNAAEAITKQQGALTLSWQITAALANIETHRGNLAQVRAYHTQARAALDFITAHTPAEWSETFLNSPAVRAGLDVNPH